MAFRSLFFGLMSSSALSGLFAGYAVADFTPTLVADYQNSIYGYNANSSTFEMIHDTSITSNGTVIDEDEMLKWRAHNLFTGSSSFSTWSKANTVVTSGAEDHDGGTTGISYIPSAVTDDINWAYLVLASSTGEHRIEFYAKNDGYDLLRIGELGTYAFYATFQLSGAGSVSFSGGAGLVSSSIESIGNGWYLCTLDINPAAGPTVYFTAVPNATGENASPGVHSPNGTDGVLISAPRMYKNSLGGMQPNPFTDDSYVPTTSAEVYMPRFDWSSGVRELLVEPTGATNLLHTTETFVTQSHTVSAVAHTLSFEGTGTVTLSGASTAGPLVGTGATDRVSLTFTPSAASLTLTVTGTVSNAQLEVGSVPTSYIPNFAASGTSTRAAESISLKSAVMNTLLGGDGVTLSMLGHLTGTGTLVRWYDDANNYITYEVNASGDAVFTQTAAATVDMATSAAALSVGINTAFSFAGRHGANVIQGAVGGTANTANTTPTALVDNSGNVLSIAYSGGPQRIRRIVGWPSVTSETAIEEATV